MNFLRRILRVHQEADPSLVEEFVTDLFRRIGKRQPFAVLPYEETIKSRRRIMSHDVKQLCDVRCELFITPLTGPAPALQRQGITALASDEVMLIHAIADKARKLSTPVFLLSQNGQLDLRLAMSFNSGAERPLNIVGSRVVEQDTGVSDHDIESIMVDVEQTGAQICFAAIDARAARRLAAKSRKRRKPASYIILPNGLTRLAIMYPEKAERNARWESSWVSTGWHEPADRKS